MKDFFSKVVSGEFGFDSLKESIIRFNEAVFTHPDMTFLSDFFNSAAGVMPYVTIAVMFLFLFLGKKLLPQIKFVCSFFKLSFTFCISHHLICRIINFLFGHFFYIGKTNINFFF